MNDIESKVATTIGSGLRGSENRARSLDDSFPDAIFWLDRDDVVTDFLPGEGFVPYLPIEELVGHAVLDSMPPDVAAPARMALERARREGMMVTIEYSLPMGDDVLGHFEARIVPLGKGNVQLIIRDINMRKRNEDSIRKANDDLERLLTVSRELASTLELEPLLEMILSQLGQVVRFTSASVVTLENGDAAVRTYFGAETGGAPESFTMPRARLSADALIEVIEQGRTASVSNLLADNALAEVVAEISGSRGELPPEAIAWMGVPLVAKGETIGLLSIVQTRPEPHREDELRFVEAFASQVVIALENARLYRQAKESATIAERTRLARELHDSVTQALYSLTLYADAARLALESGKAGVAASHISEVRGSARQAMSDMRRLIFELRPPILDEAGLVGALQARIESVEGRSGVRADFHADVRCDLPGDVESELYHISLEALNNMLKHSGATRVVVSLECPSDGLRLMIRDDGVGFDPESIRSRGGFGLKSMRERAQSIGAEFSLETAPGRGTIIRVEMKK